MKLILFFIGLLVLSCSSHPQRLGTLTVEALKDTCYFLKDTSNHGSLEVFRDVEIIENTLSDTILLGFAVVPTGYTGSFNYLRVSDTVLEGYNPEYDVSSLPKTKTICVNLYQKRSVQGELIIRYRY